MPHQLEEYEKGQIKAYYHMGMSQRRIARELGKSQATVCKFLKKLRETGEYKRKHGSGRKRQLSNDQEKQVVALVRKKRKITRRKVIMQLNLGNDVSEKTIGNVIRRAGGKSKFQIRKPFISETNRQKRVKWAQDHLGWSLYKWKQVLWSDESPYVLRYQGRERIWVFSNDNRYDTELLRGTVKHDKKIMVWGCFSWWGTGDLYQVKGIMNAAKYKQILIHHMYPSAHRLFRNKKWIFQHDNDPKHTSHIIQSYSRTKGLIVLDWPSQSPDLNPIENLWFILDRMLKDRKSSNEAELFDALSEGWKNIELDTLRSLIKSMPKRCQAVIDANGYPTKY